MVQLSVDRPERDDVPWNFTVNVVDIMFITLGLSLVSRETVMPVLASYLTDSKLVIGLIPAIFSLGFYLPQLLMANFSEGLRYKKPFVMLVGGLGERLPYLLIGVAVWALAASAPTLTMGILLAGLGISAFGAGIGTPAWYDMIAKVIPVHRRGIWSGIGHSLGALMGIGGAFLVGYILAFYLFPTNFAILFFLAAVAMTISWGGLALTREPPSVVNGERTPIRSYLRRLPAILRRDRNYTRFLLSRSLVQLGTMAGAFFIIYGTEHFQIDGIGVGRLTAILIGSTAVMNLVWGFIGDRLGHKAVLAGAAFCMAGAVAVAWTAPSQAWLSITFVLLGAYLAADMVSGLNIILEFCTPEERPTYIGLTNTLLAPMVTLAPMLGGWLADTVDYEGLFSVALAVATLGGLLITLWVREPRGNDRVTR
jgi:MFS family permease